MRNVSVICKAVSFFRPTKLALALALLSGPVLAPVLAFAQVPAGSQVPPGETVERTGPAAQFSFPPAQGLQAPEGAGAIRFNLGTLTVEGTLPALAAQTAALAPASGTSVSVGDIYAFAGALQKAYLDAGHPLVRVLVPPQDLDRASGNIAVRVVSGFIDGVDVTALPARVQKPVARILAGLVGKTAVTASDLEHGLLLAGETAGLRLRTALTPGTRTGATVLVLTGEHRLVQSALAIDNRLAEDLGREQVTASLSLNSLFGYGDRLIATIATAPDAPSLSEGALRRYGSLYASVPVMANGLELGFEVLGTSSTPKGASALLALTSNFAKASVFASFPIQRRRDRAMTARLSLDTAFEEQETALLGFAVPLFTDRTRVVRASLEGYRPLPLGINFGYETQVSQGLDGLGARSQDEASFLNPLSRLDADASFTKADVRFTLTRPFGENVSGSLTIAGSTGFGEPLLRSEQGSIVSGDLISGPPSGSIVGDDTLAARFELRRRFNAGRVALLPYGFVSTGRATLQRPTTQEEPETNAQGAGIGMEVSLQTKTDQIWRGRIEWGKTQFNGPRPDRSDVSFSLVSRF